MLMPWDKPDHIDYLKIFKILRGYFGYENLLIGGSYVYSKELDIKWSGKDIDIFILIPRMETWALKNILDLIFDSVELFDAREADYEDMNKFMKNKDQYYKIDGQWKRILAYKNGMMYDLIFVDDNKPKLIEHNTGSDLSKLYYEVSYNEVTKLSLHHDSQRYKNRLINIKKCNIEPEQCTEAYASKVKNICEQLNIKVREIGRIRESSDIESGRNKEVY